MKGVHPRLLQSEPLRRCRLENCRGACCLHGSWVDRLEAVAILDAAAHIQPHLLPERRNPATWFDDRREPDRHALSGEVWHTSVWPQPDHYGGTACVFWRPEDARCALQVAAVQAGWHPWRLKPFYCILHPLDLDEAGRITLDETAALLDEPASCLRPAARAVPLIETFTEELRYLLGERGYERLRWAVREQRTS